LRTGQVVITSPTGWPRVDRTVDEIRDRLATAMTAEQFQAVGLLCREAINSLAQAIYDPTRHAPTDGRKISPTDADAMIEQHIAIELGGKSNEYLR
jgi:hypothetical protein